jgi:hypothetical protein
MSLKPFRISEPVLKLSITLANLAGWHASNDGVFRHISSNYGSGCDHRTITNDNAWQDRHASPQIGMVTNTHRSTDFFEGWTLHIVFMGIDPNLAGDVDAVANRDSGSGVIETVIA